MTPPKILIIDEDCTFINWDFEANNYVIPNNFIKFGVDLDIRVPLILNGYVVARSITSITELKFNKTVVVNRGIHSDKDLMFTSDVIAMDTITSKRDIVFHGHTSTRSIESWGNVWFHDALFACDSISVDGSLSTKKSLKVNKYIFIANAIHATGCMLSAKESIFIGGEWNHVRLCDLICDNVIIGKNFTEPKWFKSLVNKIGCKVVKPPELKFSANRHKICIGRQFLKIGPCIVRRDDYTSCLNKQYWCDDDEVNLFISGHSGLFTRLSKSL